MAAQTAQYTIAPGPNSRFGLEVEKTGFLRGKKHIFIYDRYSGALRLDRAKPENSSIELRVESASIQCLDTWVSDKDKKKILDVALNEMMEASRHPHLAFSSKKITAKEAKTFEVHGVLTIRGVQKPVIVTVTMHSERDWEGRAVVNMKDYGLKPPSAALGTVGTKELMTVTFRLIATPPAT